MAIGDAAAAKGYPLVDVSDDLKDGAEEINLTRDLIAAEVDARAAGDALAFPKANVVIASTAPAVVNGGLWLKPVT